MWADAKRDGRPVEYRWRPLFNAAKLGWRQLLSTVQWRCQDAKSVDISWGAPNYRIDLSRYLASSPHCGNMWRRYCCLTSFFPIVDMCLSWEDIARQSCAMVPRRRICGDFLHPVFSASRVQYVSDLHLKFALRPHHVWKYGIHPICDGWDRQGKKKKDKRNHKAKI